MIINMNNGGTERALLNMIAEMPEEKYDITILMLEKYGGFLDFIPERVHREYVHGYSNIKDILNQPPRQVIKKLFAKNSIGSGLKLLFIYLMVKMFKNKGILFKYLLKNIPKFEDKYDIAIAYAGPMDFISYFVIHKIKADRKIQWIHFDVNKIGFNEKFAGDIYKHFDKLFAVSKEAKEKLLNKFPELINKTKVFYNIVSSKTIIDQSMKGNGFNDKYNGLRILTVGRLAPEKGQDIAIDALGMLRKEGYEVRWYCIGEGSARQQYETLIEQYNLKESFILLGKNANPYPYMNQCDIYVQPSRYEGFCITLLEAKSLVKPIVATDVNGVREQITDGETGLIVDIDKDKIVHAIKGIIKDNTLKKRLTNNLFKERFDSSVDCQYEKEL